LALRLTFAWMLGLPNIDAKPSREMSVDKPEPDTGGSADHWGGACPAHWLLGDVGRYLVGDDASPMEVGAAGRAAVSRGSSDLDELLASAYAAHDVIATELRLAGPRLGYRRTVFALSPAPVALMLFCLRCCHVGDDVSVLQHTAGQGTVRRSACWPFGMATAEQLTRPPERPSVPLPDGLEDLAR
jgi:hypothetical protein